LLTLRNNKNNKFNSLHLILRAYGQWSRYMADFKNVQLLSLRAETQKSLDFRLISADLDLRLSKRQVIVIWPYEATKNSLASAIVTFGKGC
jgi:hypothetical protein